MIRNLSLSVIVALLLSAAGCSDSSSLKAVSQEMATLDEAYRAGVLTKAEYDAKKAGLQSQASALDALEKAVAAGAVTKDDYPAMRSRLIAKGMAVAALEQAHSSGVFSDQEYAARKAALTATPSVSPGAPDVAAAASPHTAAHGLPPTSGPTAAPAKQVDCTPDESKPGLKSISGDCYVAQSGYKDSTGGLANLFSTHTEATDTRTRDENGTFVVESSLGSSQTGKGSKYVLPSWIPAYPGATTTSNAVTPVDGHTQYSQGLQSKDSLKTVIDFYRTHLTDLKATQTFLNDTAGYINLENGKYKVTISAGHYYGDAQTTFTVNVEEK